MNLARGDCQKYLVPLWNLRDCFAAISLCLSASSSLLSLCCSSVERAWPELTNASGVCEETRAKLQNSCRFILYMCLRWGCGSDLISEHEEDYFQHMHAPLLLARGGRQELNQVIKASVVHGPQQPIVNAGITVHLLQERRIKRKTLTG